MYSSGSICDMIKCSWFALEQTLLSLNHLWGQSQKAACSAGVTSLCCSRGCCSNQWRCSVSHSVSWLELQKETGEPSLKVSSCRLLGPVQSTWPAGRSSVRDNEPRMKRGGGATCYKTMCSYWQLPVSVVQPLSPEHLDVWSKRGGDTRHGF